MKLSLALMFPLLCLGVAGCSGIQERIRTPFDARSATGPNTLAAPLTAPASTITVAPQKAPAKLYNMNEGEKRSVQTASARRSGTSSKKSVAKTEESPPTARSVSVPAQTKSEVEAEPPEPVATGGADESLNLRPARKGDNSSSLAPAQQSPQSYTPSKTQPAAVGETEAKPADVLPVSSPTTVRRVDSRLSS